MSGELRLTLGQPELILTFQSTPLARTYLDLGAHPYSDMDGYTYGMLDQGEGLRLVFPGGEMPIVLGLLTPQGIYERLTGKTYLDLDGLTYADMDIL